MPKPRFCGGTVNRRRRCAIRADKAGDVIRVVVAVPTGRAGKFAGAIGGDGIDDGFVA
jgi:hypothetical protein